MARTLLIAGATGLIGTAATHMALNDTRFQRVITWGRKPLENTQGRIEHWGPVNGDLVAGLRTEPVDAVICCLGTTIKAVKGDKQAFIHVDKDLVLALGRWASGKNIHFCVVSALGADAKSMVFYNRVKGEMENELRRLDLAALHIFHPSILDGPRSENRTGERIGLAVMKFLKPLLPVNSRPMPSAMLAKALLATAAANDSGTHVHTYRGIATLAQ